MDRKKIIYIGIMIIITVFASVTYFSYAFFASREELPGRLNIVAGTLDYKIESNDLNNNSITLEANESKQIELTITSLNTIDSEYELYYEDTSDVEVGYLTDNDTPTGTIASNGTKTVSVVIRNNSNTSKTVTFGVQGGFVNKELVLATNRNSLIESAGLCIAGKTYEFDYAEDENGNGTYQEFNATCSGTYKVELWGASGGTAYSAGYAGGAGGYTSGNILLNNNTKLYIYVGEQGFGEVSSVRSYNGGGSGGYKLSKNYYGASGGGATDIRYFGSDYTPTTSDLEWDSSLGLNSRIMVAGAGGGSGWEPVSVYYSDGGNSGGLNGYIPSTMGTTSATNNGGGGTQTSGGTSKKNAGTFGIGGDTYDPAAGSGGGGGYYGGGGTSNTSGGGGGSSYISGYLGCLAIAENSTSEPRALKDGCTSTSRTLECSTHYSGYVFTDAVMIDGKGCDWSTGSATNCGANQPQPDGTMATGHTGNGYAKITYLGTRKVTFNANDGNVSESTRTVNYGYEIGTLPTPTKDGYTFKGWFLYNDRGLSIDENYIPEENITLYARYAENNVSYSKTFSYTGDYQTFIAPYDGVYKIELWGAQGGNSGSYTGGKGSYILGNILLNKNQNLYIYVGGYSSTRYGGYNGGGGASSGTKSCVINSGGGGGATDLRIEYGNWDNTSSLTSRIMVAAGGGGAVQLCSSGYSNGMPGGTTSSVSGTTNYWSSGTSYYKTVTGATQTTAGCYNNTSRCGSFGLGGESPFVDSSVNTCLTSGSCSYSGGGGGAGYYGGSTGFDYSTPGTGGSSFISGYTGCVAITSANSLTPRLNSNGVQCADGTTDITCSYHYSNFIFTDTSMASGIQTGNGKAVITLVNN